MNRKRSIFFILCPLFVSVCTFASGDSVKQPPDANDLTSEMLGKWTCIAYVENIDDFSAEQEIQEKTLFLKGIELKDKDVAVWIFNNDCTCKAPWDSQSITSILECPASFELKTLRDERFLFIEWITNDATILNKKPCYYVLKKTSVANETDALESDPTGRWTVVDYVETIDDFDPKQRSLNVLPSLRKLYFYKNGTVWWIFKDNFKRKKTWSGNTVDYDPSYPAHFTIKQIDEKEYLFIEWISGDVTIRGQKPRFYVLRRTE